MQMLLQMMTMLMWPRLNHHPQLLQQHLCAWLPLQQQQQQHL
jgi:hypothetical protein